MDYGIMLCEDLMEEELSRGATRAAFVGARAGIGAVVGATGAAAIWAHKRMTLNIKLKECKDNKCREAIKIKIDSKEKLSKTSIKKIKVIQKKATIDIQEILKQNNIAKINKEIDKDWESI